jgi:hypothetical protein
MSETMSETDLYQHRISPLPKKGQFFMLSQGGKEREEKKRRKGGKERRKGGEKRRKKGKKEREKEEEKKEGKERREDKTKEVFGRSKIECDFFFSNLY